MMLLFVSIVIQDGLGAQSFVDETTCSASFGGLPSVCSRTVTVPSYEPKISNDILGRDWRHDWDGDCVDLYVQAQECLKPRLGNSTLRLRNGFELI